MSFPRLLSTCIVLLIMLAMLAFNTCSPINTQETIGTPQTIPERTIRITLLHLNDVYQSSPVDKGTRGGLARVATLRDKIKAESPNTLLILAGDTISPSVASKVFKGRQMIEAWNAVGLDYAVLGNHEFDLGDLVLRERMQESRFLWLASNVFDKRTGKPFGNMLPYIIRDFRGLKIGFFGVLTPDTARTSKPGPNVEFLDPYKTAARLVPEMKARGAKVIVAISHLPMSQDKKLARSAPIDVIIGGHEHEPLQSLSGCTPIFKVGSDARNLGRIDLNIAEGSGTLESIDWEIIPVTKDVPEDPEVAAVVSKYESKLSSELDKPVGQTSVILDARQDTNRSQETNLGSFIADAYRISVDADVALLNGGSIRSNTTYGPGEITQKDILSILPFENPIVKVEVTGATLRAALEHGVSRIVEDKEAGCFPQVSGLEFTYDPSRPPGSRIVSVTVNGQPLGEQKTYTLATNTYVINGGDAYTMFRDVRYLVTPEEGQVEPAVIMNAISTAQTIAPQTNGRIKRINEPGKN
ncbi:MAG TPA: 5'-nucleotidase C-terminal domain-containing protein [Thermodesulfobacteriota bacterium]|nr:5'-nucleotidase C-terminal domain-containing protein [Thermodesulfobacteriota bacterium]